MWVFSSHKERKNNAELADLFGLEPFNWMVKNEVIWTCVVSGLIY